MRGSVKVIKLTTFMSILFLVLTYFTAVNIETQVLELNTIWFSNNFALTIFGGAFASMLVVLICEVQKYITAKASVEDYIFCHAFYLYQALFLMQHNICDYQKNTGSGVPKNLLDETTKRIQSEVLALQNTDYAPLRQKNLLLTSHQKFCGKTVIDLQPIINSSSAVKIAINKAELNYMKQNLLNRMITSADEPLRTVLSIQLDRVSEALEKVDEYLKDIDKYCKQRYGWEKLRKQIDSNYVNIFEAWDFEKEFSEET